MAERQVRITIEDMNVVRQLKPEFNELLVLAAMAREDAEARVASQGQETGAE